MSSILTLWQTTPLKTSSEKPLPPKPTLRAQDSPERRGVFDATDLTATSLNGRFPLLEPASSPESGRSDQLSPVDSSFQVTPSLLSRNQSLNSVSTGVVEYGVATSTTIQSVINPYVGVDVEHADDAKVTDTRGQAAKHISHGAAIGSSSNNYLLNAPGSAKPQRQGSVLMKDQFQYRRPSRSSGQSSAGSKTNRSMLRGRQALSVRGRQSPSVPNARHDGQGAVQQEDVPSDLSLATPISSVFIERDRTKDLLEEHFTDEGTQRTSSKYGYSIRESFEAQDAIMGQPGSSKPRNRLGGLLSSHSTFTTAGRNGPVRELNLELSTPNAKSTRIGHPASALQPPTRKAPHPPRTSSLPSAPSPSHASGTGSNVKMGLGPNGRTPPVPKTQVGGVYSSESGEDVPPTSRLSLFYRQTTASAARASFNTKKISEPRPSTLRMPQSRTLASLGDVGKGVKNFGKKVGKIIPGRRSIAVEATSEELLTITAENSNGPRRQASRLLTTYKNSGMDDSSDEHLHHFVPTDDSFIEPEPVDRHEPEGTQKQKEIWRKASRNRVHDAETGRYIRFGQRDVDSSDDDDERPPSRRRILGAPRGHYVEDAVEDGRDELIDSSFNFPSNEDDENSEDAGLPPTQRASVEGSVAPDGVDNPIAAGGLISDARFDQLIAETDVGARQLVNYAMALEDSRPRTLMIETATHLGEGLMHVRQARIEVVRVNQLIEEITVILAANTHRMSVIMQELSASARST
jgi:hypothetical protein